MARLKMGLLFLGRKRPGFDQVFGAQVGDRVREVVRTGDWETYEPSEKVVDDPSLQKGLRDCEDAGVDVLCLMQTTMADSRLALTLHQLWPHPVVLWATPENQKGDMISSCSLVGVHNWASILGRLGHPFEIVYGDPDRGDTLQQLDRSARIVAAIRRLRSSRIGVIGGHAPGYFAMSDDRFELSRALGIQLQSYSLSQFVETVEEIEDQDVEADVRSFEALGLPLDGVTAADMEMASRIYLGMRHYYESEGMDALAIRCWPELPNVLGQWPYVGMTRLAEEQLPIGMEGDIDGALCALIGKHLGLGPCYLSDWLEHDADTITLWHGGNLPFSMSPPVGQDGGPRATLHFNIRKPAVVESTLTPGVRVTVMRLWRMEGRYHLVAFEAETIEPRRHLMGTNGLIRVLDRDADALFRDLCDEGMPHHVAVFQGAHAQLLRAAARAMDFQWSRAGL